MKRIDEEDAVSRTRGRVLLKRLHLAAKRHHPAVRVCALHRNSKHAAGENVGGRAASADVGRTAGRECAVDSLGAP